MSSVVTVPLLQDAIDSFYYWVLGRVQTINPARDFGGIVQARDWPMKEANLNTPYLLITAETPVPFMKSVSQYQPNMNYKLSWAWMIQGDNIPFNAQAANRGNKYKINMQMIQEMLAGHYPGFCSKAQYTVADDGSGNAVQVITPYDPAEQIRWSMPRFIDRIDKQTGILFCSGVVDVAGFAPAILQ